jgi:hypothetical protein
MSARKQKEIRKGYHDAGAIYWTKDMEVIIRRIRAWRTIWAGAAAIFFVYALFLKLHDLGVF